MKIFLKELWEEVRERDEKMSDEEIKCWKDIMSEIQYPTDIPTFMILLCNKQSICNSNLSQEYHQ